jgi:hypothetical protein
MAVAASERFTPRHGADRDVFLALTALVWTGIIAGFGSDIARNGFSFPLIVHFHAAVFVGWLVLFTTQLMLVRVGNVRLHRRLGVAGLVLGSTMLVLGPATAIHMDALKFAASGKSPVFLSVQLGDMVAFAGLAGAGLLLRGEAAAHKRLMLLATMFISDAGFARWLGDPIEGALGHNFVGFFLADYLCSALLILALGAYDLISRRRLHPAYVAGATWAFAIQFTANWLYFNPAWKPIAMKLIGH